MQTNPSKDLEGNIYHSYNAIIISNDFIFTGNQVPTSYMNNERSTKWVEVEHKESGIKFNICSLHAKVGSRIETLEPIIAELLNNKNNILCGDFNINSSKLQSYASSHNGYISNYIKKMHTLLWLGKGPDYIFTNGPNLEIINFNTAISMQINKKIPHNVIRATIQLMSKKYGGTKHYTASKFIKFILSI